MEEHILFPRSSEEEEGYERSPVVSEASGSRKIITLASGKGGVGKTNLAVNLAIALIRFGRRVLVVDADLGLANVDILLGISPRYNLSHVLSGKKTIEEIITTGPAGIAVAPCNSGGARGSISDVKKSREIVDAIKKSPDIADIVFIDTARGIADNIIDFLLQADEVFLVTTPEPTSIMDSYGVIKVLAQEKERSVVRLIVNMADSNEEAENVLQTMSLVTKQFFNVNFEYLGWVSYDRAVSRAVMQQQPVVLRFPSSVATRDINNIAMRIAGYEVDFLHERGMPAMIKKIMNRFGK